MCDKDANFLEGLVSLSGEVPNGHTNLEICDEEDWADLLVYTGELPNCDLLPLPMPDAFPGATSVAAAVTALRVQTQTGSTESQPDPGHLAINSIQPRNRERHRQYRAQKKIRMEGMEQQVKTHRAEIEHLKQENAKLEQQRSVLHNLQQFWDGLAGSLSAGMKTLKRTITGGSSSNSSSSSSAPTGWLEHHVYQGVITHSCMPSDEQLERFLRPLNLKQLQEMSLDFTSRRFELVKRWKTTPAERPVIEAKLHDILQLISRVAVWMLANRPILAAAAVARTLLPPGAEGKPHPKIYDAIEAVQLTPEQMQLLEREWRRYTHTVSQGREQARDALHRVAHSQACDPGMLRALGAFAAIRAEGSIDLADLADVLQAYPEKEAEALIRLAMFFQNQVLSRTQRMEIMAATFPYRVDVLQFCTVLFDNKETRLF